MAINDEYYNHSRPHLPDPISDTIKNAYAEAEAQFEKDFLQSIAELGYSMDTIDEFNEKYVLDYRQEVVPADHYADPLNNTKYKIVTSYRILPRSFVDRSQE